MRFFLSGAEYLNEFVRLRRLSKVLRAGVEPARPTGHDILSVECLPISPPEHILSIFFILAPMRKFETVTVRTKDSEVF